MSATPTTVMATDFPPSPSIESTTSNNSFTDDYETLPADGPIAHAHILAVSSPTFPSLPSSSLHLQDALVTTLFHASPLHLERFLDPTVNTFKIIFKRKDDTQLVIWRKGIEVFVRLTPSPIQSPSSPSNPPQLTPTNPPPTRLAHSTTTLIPNTSPSRTSPASSSATTAPGDSS